MNKGKRGLMVLGLFVVLVASFSFVFAQCSSGTSCSETSFIISNFCNLGNENKCVSSGQIYCGPDREIFNTSSSLIGCSGGDGIIGNGNDCCPSGFNCTDSGCRRLLVNGTYSLCVQYKTQAECNADIYGAGTSGQGDGCKSIWTQLSLWRVPNSCRCSWESNSCVFKYNVSDLGETDGENFYECVKTYTLGQCDANNEQVLSWTVTTPSSSTSGFPNSSILYDTGCVAGSKRLDCGEKPINVPGFSFFNFVMVLVTLTAIYGFFLRKNN